jgi:hypothetical protein
MPETPEEKAEALVRKHVRQDPTPLVGICGASGSGKTTALVLLFGVIRGLLKGRKPESRSGMTKSERIQVKKRSKNPYDSWRFLDVKWRDSGGLDKWVEEVESLKEGRFPSKTDPASDMGGENWFFWRIENRIFGFRERFEVQSTDLAGESFLRAIRPDADETRRRQVEHLYKCSPLFFLFQPSEVLRWHSREIAGFINFFTEIKKAAQNAHAHAPKKNLYFVAAQCDKPANRDVLKRYLEGPVDDADWKQTLHHHGQRLVQRFVEEEMDFLMKEIKDVVECNYGAVYVGEVAHEKGADPKILDLDIDRIPQFFLGALRSPFFRVLQYARDHLDVVLPIAGAILLLFIVLLICLF